MGDNRGVSGIRPASQRQILLGKETGNGKGCGGARLLKGIGKFTKIPSVAAGGRCKETTILALI